MAKQLYIPEFFADTYSGGNTIPWDVAARYFRNSDHFGQRYADGSGMLENLIGFEKFYDERLTRSSLKTTSSTSGSGRFVPSMFFAKASVSCSLLQKLHK